MSEKKTEKQASVEIPQIGMPLESPYFITPTALTDPRSYGTQPFPGPMPLPLFPLRDPDDR